MCLRRYALSFVLILLVAGLPKNAEASAILFTERAAFELAADPNLLLTVTDIDVRGSGDVRLTYSDILVVVYDILGLLQINGCWQIGCVGSIPQGGDPFGNSYVSVRQFSTPIAAVGYDVLGVFSLNGMVVNATTPVFFGFIFDEPTTQIPLPQVAVFQTPGMVPHQGLYNATNISVQTVAEPATMFPALLGTTTVLLLLRRMRNRRLAK